MQRTPGKDQLLLVRIEGMHCHRCERRISDALSKLPGVSEVEVDMPSGQASVLFREAELSPKQIVDAVTEAGYQVTGSSTLEKA